jgi:hypothetical protein
VLDDLQGAVDAAATMQDFHVACHKNNPRGQRDPLTSPAIW